MISINDLTHEHSLDEHEQVTYTRMFLWFFLSNTQSITNSPLPKTDI